MKNLTLLCCFLLFLVACKGNSVDDPNSLNGQWVEATGRGDTLIFRDNQTSLLEIKRGYVMLNGYRLPRAGSGLWQYKLLKDYKMEVQNTLSSLYAPTTSHIELKDKILYVSNFYEAENKSLELRSFNKK